MLDLYTAAERALANPICDVCLAALWAGIGALSICLWMMACS